MKKTLPILGLILTIVGMCVAAAVWAGEEHLEIKNDQDTKMKVNNQEIKEHFVDKIEFGIIKENVSTIKEEQKEQGKKIDKMYDLLIEQRPRVINFHNRRTTNDDGTDL